MSTIKIPPWSRRIMAIERAASIALVFENDHGEDFDLALQDALDAETELAPDATPDERVEAVWRDLETCQKNLGERPRVVHVRTLIRQGVITEYEGRVLEPEALGTPLW